MADATQQRSFMTSKQPPVTDDGDTEEAEQSSDAPEDSDGSSKQQRRAAAIVKEDMAKIEKIFQEKGMRYRLIDRIGEGTFSTVYQAEDLMYERFRNDWDSRLQNTSQWSSRPASQEGGSSTPRLVAVKKIYVTSSPLRIFNELELLHSLRGCSSVCPLITAFRYQDQVVAILPHFKHQDFRMYYRSMSVYDIKVYFRSLFEALAAVHKHRIIHRDIKPTNFLYDIEAQRGVLVDFGLAEREGTESLHCLCQDPASTRKAKIQSSRAFTQEPPEGYPKDDSRPTRRANRAGTRGFRAPEVLFKCTTQTTKIDIWSAGVILLTILAQRFPFFNSADDMDAMVELATIFGRHRMRQCAMLHGSTFECTLNTIGDKGFSLSHIVQWSTSVTRPEHEEDLEQDVKETVKFLEQLLELDARRRISARGALAHPFLVEDDDDTDEIDVL